MTDLNLTMPRLAFIGTGSMGSALARAARKNLPPENIMLANRTREKAEALARCLGGCAVASNVRAAAWADYIFLGVKPQMMADLLSEIAPALAKRESRFVLVSMAAGMPIQRIQDLAGGAYPVIRIMPNTPAAIGEGMILYAARPSIKSEETEAFLDFMSGAGRFASLPEHLMDAGSAVSGCGPAFAALFLEALADGGVACGLPRVQAQELAAQMLAGTARLALETGRHPGALKDDVCSPGGTTIQGVRQLESLGFRSAVIEAVIAAYKKNQDLA